MRIIQKLKREEKADEEGRRETERGEVEEEREEGIAGGGNGRAVIKDHMLILNPSVPN